MLSRDMNKTFNQWNYIDTLQGEDLHKGFDDGKGKSAFYMFKSVKKCIGEIHFMLIF
jgi:hypothetical protein